MAWKQVYEPDVPPGTPHPQYGAPPPLQQQQYYAAPPQQIIAQVPQNTVMGGIQANIQQMLEVISAGEQLKKMFKEPKEEKPKDDLKDKKKWTNFTRSDMFCLSGFLILTSPWTGYMLTSALVHQLGSWSTLLGTIAK